jgi:hypothetical protein
MALALDGARLCHGFELCGDGKNKKEKPEKRASHDAAIDQNPVTCSNATRRDGQ